MFLWHGKSIDKRREHGVDFAVKNTLLQHVEIDTYTNLKRLAKCGWIL